MSKPKGNLTFKSLVAAAFLAMAAWAGVTLRSVEIDVAVIKRTIEYNVQEHARMATDNDVAELRRRVDALERQTRQRTVTP